MRLLLILICLLVSTGHAEDLRFNEIETQEKIRAALERLVERTHSDAFVIIEDKTTGKFVQFAGGNAQGLVFDLPAQTLNANELERAHHILTEFGIQLGTWEVYDRPGGEVVGSRSGFNKNLGNNIDRATKITWAVLRKIYDLGATLELKIEEN